MHLFIPVDSQNDGIVHWMHFYRKSSYMDFISLKELVNPNNIFP